MSVSRKWTGREYCLGAVSAEALKTAKEEMSAGAAKCQAPDT